MGWDSEWYSITNGTGVGNYVFNSKENSIKNIIKFFTSRITTLLIEILFMFIMVDILKINDIFYCFIANQCVI